MKIKPINHKIIVSEVKMNGEIIMPESSGKEKVFKVVVTDTKKIDKDTKVLIDEYAGKEKKIDGKTLFFIDYEDIIAIIE